MHFGQNEWRKHFAIMWAAEMKGVRWQWPEKRSLGRMKVTGEGGYHHEGCPVVVPLHQTGYCLPVKRIHFICPGWGLSQFPSCQHYLVLLCTWPLNQTKGNSATTGWVVLCSNFSLHSLQWSGKYLCVMEAPPNQFSGGKKIQNRLLFWQKKSGKINQLDMGFIQLVSALVT